MNTICVGRDYLKYIIENDSGHPIKQDFIWISIREPDESDNFYDSMETNLSSKCVNKLVLRFHDLICDDYSFVGIKYAKFKIPTFVPFNLSHKNQIDSFIDSYKSDLNLCLVNCYLGVSRSSVISAYIERNTGESDWQHKYYESKFKMPCPYICNILGMPIKK